MAGILGLTRGQWMRYTDRINLVPFYPGPKYPAELAGQNATMLSVTLLRPRRLVLLGANVARAFQVYGQEPCQWVWSPLGPRVMLLPHPSGRNLWYNDPDNHRRVRRALREHLERIHEASASERSREGNEG